jgi:hypothetical protein
VARAVAAGQPEAAEPDKGCSLAGRTQSAAGVISERILAMRFLMLIWAESSAASGDQTDYDVWAAFDDRARAAGVFVNNGALQPAATDARLVRTTLSGHDLADAVERRPFTEGAAQIEAFYLMECPDIETAQHWANQLPTYGQIEVRPLIDFG